MADVSLDNGQPPRKDVCVQYDGEEYDWPGLVGSPDIAVLQENILHYFHVPVERQAIYSKEGPVLTTADVAQELQCESPRFSVYDRRGSFRRDSLSELVVTAGDHVPVPPASSPSVDVVGPPGFPDAAGVAVGRHTDEMEDLGMPRPCVRFDLTEPATAVAFNTTWPLPARQDLDAAPAMGDECVLLCREFEVQVDALRGTARRNDVQLQNGQEARAEALLAALRDADARCARALGEARAEEARAGRDAKCEMDLRLSSAHEEMRQRKRDYQRNLGELATGLQGAVGASESTRELHDRLRREVCESTDCIRGLRRENATLNHELVSERHECAALLGQDSQLRAAGQEAGAREQRLEEERASAVGPLPSTEELRLRDASQRALIRDLQGALEQQRLKEASAQARSADLERSLEQHLLLEASHHAILRGLDDTLSLHIHEHASQTFRMDELERELEFSLQERVELRTEEASLREHQRRHSEDTSAELKCVSQELQCELDRCSTHGVLQQTHMNGLEAVLTQPARVEGLERELERRSEQCALQQAGSDELEDVSAQQSRQPGVLELELDRLRQQARLQELQQELELERQARQEALQQVRAKDLDDASEACAARQRAALELELRRLRQQETPLQASVRQLEDVAPRHGIQDTSQQALVQELRQLELAQQARLSELECAAEQRRQQEATHQSQMEELALKLERQAARDVAQHARMQELERALEQALLKENLQQARAAWLEEKPQDSTGPRLLQCEEQLAELEQELVDTRRMHHWQRTCHKDHIAELQRDLAEAQQGRACGANGGLERTTSHAALKPVPFSDIQVELAEARAELELRRDGQLRQLQWAEELQRAGFRRGHAAQAHVDIFERLLRELQAGLPREPCAPAPLVLAAAAPAASARQVVTMVKAPPRPWSRPRGHGRGPEAVVPALQVASAVVATGAASPVAGGAMQAAPRMVALRSPPMARPASPLRLAGPG